MFSETLVSSASPRYGNALALLQDSENNTRLYSFFGANKHQLHEILVLVDKEWKPITYKADPEFNPKDCFGFTSHKNFFYMFGIFYAYIKAVTKKTKMEANA